MEFSISITAGFGPLTDHLQYQASMEVRITVPKTVVVIEYKLKDPCLLSHHSENIRMQFVGQIL